MHMEPQNPVDIAPPPAPAPHQGPKPLPTVIAILILLVAAGGIWFWLTQTPSGTGTTATSTPEGTVEKQTIRDAGDYYDIEANYPATTPLKATAGARADAKAVEILHGFVAQEIANFKENSGLSSLTPEDIQVQGLGGDRKYALGVDYTIHTSPATVSYVFQMYQDTMGAHPNAYYRTFVFDKTMGDGLTLADVFSPTADYVGVLSNESRNRLPALLKARTGYDADPDMLAAGTTPDADNFQNFYLDGKDLVIIFPPYQIAAYAAGTTELHIPRAELGNAIVAKYR